MLLSYLLSSLSIKMYHKLLTVMLHVPVYIHGDYKRYNNTGRGNYHNKKVCFCCLSFVCWSCTSTGIFIWEEENKSSGNNFRKGQYIYVVGKKKN